MGKLINIDNGGTLTDICVIDGATVYRTKTVTTPYDLSKCFFDGLRKASRAIYGAEDVAALLTSTDHIRYSTTQGTNALVERRGPRFGLISAAGFDTGLLQHDDHHRDLYAGLVGERSVALDASLHGAAFESAVVHGDHETGRSRCQSHRDRRWWRGSRCGRERHPSRCIAHVRRICSAHCWCCMCMRLSTTTTSRGAR